VSASTLRKSAAKPKAAAKTSARQKGPAKTGMKAGDLPEWNLADLYPSIDAPEVTRDLERLDEDCASPSRLLTRASSPSATRKPDGGEWLAAKRAGAMRRSTISPAG
jgi:oligoendopeptidase F